MSHLIWLPGLYVAAAGLLVIAWAVWPLRPRRGSRLDRQLARTEFEDAVARAERGHGGEGGTSS